MGGCREEFHWSWSIWSKNDVCIYLTILQVYNLSLRYYIRSGKDDLLIDFLWFIVDL